ncbi:copper resistance protein CopC [Solibacillus sp. MA9]|uniref:Copper resistance protein CopC n=1 Tax=Solibacillus palustris TaxID=2908203 RepID=A0ABS9UE83_9BACL|nr:copper resistance protein CopC [Solibacillus sp. MA9]MCH7322642.1 copper resistance protein CopC [Solibacillus sp. MA9]
MLKQLLFTLVAAFLFFVPKTYAHTYLDSTNPTDGATITEEIQKIDLNYSGKIEEGSIFKVLASDGAEMAMESFIINDSVLTGTLASPLPNDTYKVEWDSISEDGHPLSGSFSFTINAVASDTNNETVPGADTSKQIASDVTKIVDTLKTETDSEDGNSIWSLIIVITIILLIITVVTIYSYKRTYVKRKKNK